MLLLLLTTATAERVRLVIGPSAREGRLEVYHNGTWGTVCYYGFTHAAASVICYMLGYGYIGEAIGRRYGAGSGRIWLRVVRCNGTETSIGQCRHYGWAITLNVTTIMTSQFHASLPGWLEAQVIEKDVLKCTRTARGEQCVVIASVTRRQELFATCAGTKTSASILVTAMVPVVGRFCRTTFNAVERKQTLQIVNTLTGANTAVNTMKTSLSRASVK